MANNTTVEESALELTVTICSEDGISSVTATHYTSRGSNNVTLIDGPWADCNAGYSRAAYIVELTLSKGTNTLSVEAEDNFNGVETANLVINYFPPQTDPPEQQDYPIKVTAPGAGGVRVVEGSTRSLPFVFTNIGTLSSNFLVNVSCTNVIFTDCKKVGGTSQFYTGTLAPLASATFDIEVFANKPHGTGAVRVIAASTINGAIKDTGLVTLTIDRATIHDIVVTKALDTVFVAPGTTGSVAKFIVANPDPLAYQSATFTHSCGTLTSCSTSNGVGLAPQSDSLVSVTFNVPSSPASQLTKVVLSATTGGGGLTKDSLWVHIGSVPSPSVIVTTNTLNAGTSVARDQCLSIAAGDAAGIECGALRLAHGVPGIRTMGRERAPTLLYSSQTAAPMVLLQTNVSVRNSTLTDSLKATLIIPGTATTLSRAWPWSAACATASGCRIVFPVNADSLGLSTGLYDYTLQVRIGTGPMGQETGSFAVVNDKLSVFGAGWWLEGLERLQVDGMNMFWIGGDGSTREYVNRGGDVYTVEDKVSRPDTLLKVGGMWYRRLRNGGHVRFDAAFRHVGTVNRQGHETRFSYSSAGLLDSIILPTPTTSQVVRAFTFAWNTSASPAKLVSISGVAQSGTGSRITTLTSDGNRRITAVTDPDTRQVHYLYASGTSPRVTGRVNRLSDTTDYAYDAFGAVKSVSSRMRANPSIVTTLCAAETRSLVACSGDGTSTSPQFVSRAVTRLDGPRSDVLDITRFHIGRFGAPDTIVDALGGRTRLKRSNPAFPALVTEMTEVAGLVTQTLYNGRGLPTTVTVLSPYGGANAVTTIDWHPAWDMAVEIVSPTGEVALTGIDSATGNRLWQQRGTGDSTRVTFGYASANRLNSVSMNSQVLTRYFYDDAGLGNISKTVGARKDTTTIEVNAVGEAKIIHTPTMLNGAPTTRTEQWLKRDVMGRVTLDSTRAAALSWQMESGLGNGTTPLRAAMVVTSYDPEGRPLSVARYTPAQNINESWLGSTYASSSWTYDALGRVKTATTAGQGESHVYDPAGNLISTTTKRGLIVKQTFDPLGRMTSRTTPSVRLDQFSCVDCSVAPEWNTNPTRVPYFGTRLAAGKYSPDVEIATETAFYSYDIAGRVIQADNPYALVRRAYYPNGALKADTAITRLYNPDATSPFAPTHRSVLAYTYDLSGRRLTRTDNWSGEQTYAYDGLGQLATTTDRARSTETPVAIHFTYDERGQLIEQDIPAAGVVTNWGYDVSGLPTRRAESNATGGWYSDSLQYDVRGKRSWMLGRALFTGGPQEEFAAAYDGFGHLVASAGGAVSITERMVVDGHGNTHSRHTNRFGLEEQLVTSLFDGEHLESSTGTPRPEGRGDPSGFGPLVQQIDEVEASFDESGNMIFQSSIRTEWNGLDNNDVFVRSASGSKWNWYLYDADERLRFAEIAQLNPGTPDPIPVATQLEYWYDALGRRILVRTRVDSTTCGSTQETGDPYACQQSVIRTVWDGDQILKESRYLGGWQYSGAQLDGPNGLGAFFGTVRTTQTGAIDVPLLVWLNDTDPHVLHRNWRGNVGGATEVATGYANLTMAWPAAFTDVRHAPESRLDPPTPTGWWGSLVENQKDVTGLLYRRNRYYDPVSGRFTQEDPIGLAGGLNLYGYGNGDPINFADPFGLLACPPLCDSFDAREDRFILPSSGEEALILGATAIGAAVGGVGLAALMNISVAALAPASVGIAPFADRVAQQASSLAGNMGDKVRMAGSLVGQARLGASNASSALGKALTKMGAEFGRVTINGTEYFHAAQAKAGRLNAIGINADGSTFNAALQIGANGTMEVLK